MLNLSVSPLLSLHQQKLFVKKLAFFLLFCFSLTQVMPAAMSFAGSEKVILFTTDEEKNQEESGKDKDGKKHKTDPCLLLSGSQPGHLAAQLRLAANDELPPFPITDVPQLPPNK